MRDARRTALLAKWSAGVRLRSDERADIADLIGDTPPAPVSPAGSLAPQVLPSAPAFALEATPAEAASSRSGCKHPLIPGTPYETTFAVSVRQIKRWRSAGSARQPASYPPLDEPWRVAAWYRVVMQRRVPARLLELEEAGPPTPEPEKTASAPTPSAPSLEANAALPLTASVPLPGRQSFPAALPTSVPGLSTGYAATLDRLSQAEAIAAQRYADAAASMDPEVRSHAPSLKREWVELAETVRAYERDRGKVLRDSDAIWDKQAVLDAITSVHNVIAPGVRRLWRTIRRRHPQFHALTSVQQDEVFARESDALFSVLLNSRFTANTEPAPEPPSPPAPDQQPLEAGRAPDSQLAAA